MKKVYAGEFHKQDEDFIWPDPSVHIWNDMNEPSVFGPHEKSLPKSAIHYGNQEHRTQHNLYGF